MGAYLTVYSVLLQCTLRLRSGSGSWQASTLAYGAAL
jgi:hypothetical protein